MELLRSKLLFTVYIISKIIFTGKFSAIKIFVNLKKNVENQRIKMYWNHKHCNNCQQFMSAKWLFSVKLSLSWTLCIIFKRNKCFSVQFGKIALVKKKKKLLRRIVSKVLKDFITKSFVLWSTEILKYNKFLTTYN